MTLLSRLKKGLFTACLLCFGGMAVAQSTAVPVKHYVCPPCGSPCDKEIFDKPGICPTCHLPLVEVGSKEAEAPAKKKVAIILFDGVEIIDYAGPYEMFGVAGFEVYTVAATKAPITTYLGMTVTPNYSFADAPQPDVLVIPGGGVGKAMESEATLRYIKEATEKAQHTMSVCNGAFILANTGLLDGLTATTTRGNIPGLTQQFSKVHVVGNQRYTDNGKIITTGGLSAGIDGALHVIEKLMGEAAAEKVAYQEEYAWQKATGSSVKRDVPSHNENAVTMYICPMAEHTKVHSKSGKCELCQMELIPKTVLEASSAKAE